jgi:hypothetical protein
LRSPQRGASRAVRDDGPVQPAVEELRRILRADTATHRHLRERVVAIWALTLVVDAGGTLLIWLFEGGKGDIDGLWDAFFWTTTQLLTVSSQFPNPVSVGGRVVDIALQFYAITVVASLAGSFAAFFHRRGMERDPLNAS